MTEIQIEDPIEWLNAHPEIWTEYEGQWLIWDGGACIVAKDSESAFRLAAECGAKDPLIFKVPSRKPHF